MENNFIYNPRLPATIDETSVVKSRQQFSRCEPAADKVQELNSLVESGYTETETVSE